MTSIFSIFTEAELEAEIVGGFVSRKYNPSGWLAILNYTPAAAYSRRWNAVTLASRGLIYHQFSGNIFARPFAKFFNYGELDPHVVPLHKPAVVTPKMDGSLGIFYRDDNGDPGIATRGSFISEQALWATHFWDLNYNDVEPPHGVTPLFEIIYPQNRIVVDYGGQEALVLLAVIDNETGADIPLSEARDWWPGPMVKVRDDLSDAQKAWEAVTSGEFNGSEGVVLCWPNFNAPSMRVKIKDAEYIRLHRIVTRVSSKTIWESLKNGESLNELLDNVPDEFNAWVREQIAHFEKAFKDRFAEIDREYHQVLSEVYSEFEPVSKKEFALHVKDHPDKAYLFAFWDGKDTGVIERIWQELKPQYTTPFAEDEV